MMKKRWIVVVLVLVAMMLLASRCGGTRIESGTLRDTVFSVEHHENGATSVWFTHDDLVGYCTASQELGQKADQLIQYHGEIIATYRDIRTLDDKEAAFWQASQCGNIGVAETSGTEVMVLLSLDPVPHRATGR